MASDDGEDDDETDPDEREHLNRILEELDLDREVDMDESKPVVTSEEARVGRFAIFKVCSFTYVSGI